ncbi:PIR protein [Plasmodium ovale]|uniref:PIR protein n=1 Tax=Plasmodium ovale TaxID=36330 RepID=A0A1C3KEB5_PLAOA|nr:PIR protein [Plasmodium ovale]
MSNNTKNFTLIKLGEKLKFFKGLDLYKSYEVLNKTLTDLNNTKFCVNISFSEVDDPDVISLQKKLLRNLGILQKPEEFFVGDITKYKDKLCVYLKYWLYEQLIVNDFSNFEINLLFDFLEKHKNGCMKDKSLEKTCNFYKLSLKDINEIKNLYDYIEFLNHNDIKIYDEISKDHEWVNYFKKGLDLYKISKIRCSSDKHNNYCYEFNEFEKIYKEKSPYFSCKEKLLTLLHNKDTTLTGKSLQDNAHEGTLDPVLYNLLKKNNLLNEVKLHSFYELLKSHSKTSTSSSCVSINKYPIKEEAVICNLFEHVKNILEKWDESYAKYQDLSPNKSCEYLNYWLYGKLIHLNATPCDIEIFYLLWHKYVMDKEKLINKCNNEKSYGFSKEELINKKKLFDFLEYFKVIKEKLSDVKNENTNEYCKYIKDIFELYKYMVHKKILQSYNEEIKLFKKVLSDNNVLHLLDEKCPNMCLGLVFNEKYKTLCKFEEKPLTEQEKEKLNLCKNPEGINTVGHDDGNHEKIYDVTNLPTYSVYKELNADITGQNYYTICSKLIWYDEKHCGIFNLCNKLVRNLIKYSKMKNKERTEHCSYITHWLYDQIGKIQNINSNNLYNTVAVSELFKVRNDILHQLDTFDCLYNTPNINLKEKKEQKYLHDYFKNHSEMKCEDASSGNKCENYCNYITFISKIYAKYIDECCHCFESGYCRGKCPDFFKCDDNYNPHTLFEKLECNKFKELRETIKKVDRQIPEDHFVKWITDISVKLPHLLNWDNKKSSITSEEADNKITWDQFYIFALVSFGFFGVFLIFFIFYKFTPLGSYFNNRDSRKKMSYFENFEQQYLEDNVELSHGNKNNQRMRLAYHQA